MNPIRECFLRARHWQVFVALCGSLSVAMWPAHNTGAGVVLASIYELLFFGWIWSLGSFLTSLVPVRLRLSMRLFRFSLIYPPIYILLYIITFERPIPVLLLLPFHLLAMFGIVYTPYFVSKTLVMAEKRESVSFSGYSTEFFLTYFFPIGVWFIQPKVNHLYTQQSQALPQVEQT